VTPAPASVRRTRAARRLLQPFIAACALTCASPAHAEQADREKPINYSADTGDVNYQTKIGALSGNVVITQGTMTIHADRITFKQNPDNSVSAIAYGNPVSFRQKRDGYDEYFEGYAQRAEYDGSKQVLQLFDRALLRRGQDELRSNYISYNASTEQFNAQGRPGETPAAALEGPGPRVRGVFQPKSETPLLPKGKDDAKAGAANAPPAPNAPPVTLKPVPEIAPSPGK